MTIRENELQGVRSQGVPIQNPGLSYWQRTTRAFSLLNINRNSPVPPACSHVIIGSGLSGSLTAFELVEGGVRGEDIVILEAREAAGGASSRNAGHVRPDAFRGFTAYSNVHGADQAVKILENERLVLQRITDFVSRHNVQCDLHPTTTFEVCMTPEFAAYAAASVQACKEAGVDVSHVQFYEREEARAKTRVKNAVAAYEWPAASSHPAKLAQWLIRDVVSKGVRLFTHCPVTKVQKATSSESTQTASLQQEASTRQLWNVFTPRGSVTTPTVIHCTNAYASFLLPHLAPHVTPNRAQAHSLVATPAFSAEHTLASTYSLRYSLHHYYSLIQRQGDGTMILGVSRSNPSLSPETQATTVSLDDSYFNKEILEDGLRQLRVLFPEFDGDGGVHGEGLEHAWNGIIAMTADSVPFVGAIESLPGQYVCAGFNGHGEWSPDTRMNSSKLWLSVALP
ncbi:MAG: hypothetical protein M1837_007065 [Sclerophora amabilis]|nr:MAG: hypothetical protein M1837_007065 [Sclerophora amabilis]